jgi:hypothetical protein
MKQRFIGLATLVLAAAMTFPAAARAADSTTVHYATTMSEMPYSSPLTGTLDLTVGRDGIVHGYYFPADAAVMFLPVVGGQSGASIWLDIGNESIVHVQGEVKDGAISGSAYQGSVIPLKFTATPSTY